jgi:hypothetical protein
VVAVVAALVAIAVVLVTRHGSAAAPDNAAPDNGAVVRVGVGQGASIPGYLSDSRARLAGLPAGSTGYALVSLADYLAPEALVPVLAGVEVFQVYARVPLPHTQTAIVKLAVARIPDDVIAGMDTEADERAAQADRTGDPVAAQEAARYRQHCACAYAAVVRAPADALRRLSTRAGVRAVDPAPQVTRPDLAVFLPPLPEQTGAAEPPDDRAPLPAGSPAVR